MDDRKRSVIAFVLLKIALRDEYDIIDIPEFVYNDFGKPSIPNLPIHFSLSHCKDAVACAVYNNNIGIDIESVVPYNPDIAHRVCTENELEKLQQSEHKDIDFIKLWTMKEAVSKYEGKGVSLPFSQIKMSEYSIFTKLSENAKYALSTCNLTEIDIKYVDF